MRLSISIVTLAFFSCSMGSCQETDIAARSEELGTYHLVDANEPGEPLKLLFTLIDSTSGEPIIDAEIFFYQTNTNGQYEPADASSEHTARINGLAYTNRYGQFELITILPGEYPDQPPGNRHIHMHHVRAEGYEERGGVILFDFNVRDEVREWAKRTGFGTIINIQKEKGEWNGEVLLFLSKK